MRLCFYALFVSLFAVGIGAQTLPPLHRYTSINVTIIDGALHSELIPDFASYRAWLVIVSLPPNSTPQQQALQQAHIRQIRLEGVDYCSCFPFSRISRNSI